MEEKILKWEKVPGNHVTPGGEPLVRCPKCKDKSSYHCEGVESGHLTKCPHCGEKLK